MTEDLEAIERELMLICRHQVLVSDLRKRPAERLERSAYTVLCRLETEGPMSIGQLADAFSLDTSTINRQTAAMLRAGLLERIQDPDGGVARKLRITPEGDRRLAADRAWALRAIGRLLTDWSEEQIRALADTLTRFNSSIERAEGRPWPRHDRMAEQR